VLGRSLDTGGNGTAVGSFARRRSPASEGEQISGVDRLLNGAD
jgi:hypothetical protein